MENSQAKQRRRIRRKRGLRKRLFGTVERPRLTVFRSQQHIYAQVIDDVTGKTLAAASSLKLDTGHNVSAAAEVGKTLAAQAKAKGVKAVSFDRNGFKYHGRLKALADAARKGGLEF